MTSSKASEKGRWSEFNVVCMFHSKFNANADGTSATSGEVSEVGRVRSMLLVRGGGNVGGGQKASREKVWGQNKGPQVCGICCGVCCGAARELIENLSMTGTLGVTCQVFKGLV